MPVLNPEHLLEQAERLRLPVVGGAPRQADLRRAISAAYNSVFHAVATAAADAFVGTAYRRSPRYSLVYRSIGHGSLRRLCDEIAKPTLPQKYSTYEPQGGFGSDIKGLASAVGELQDKRYTADYDPLFRARMSDADIAIATGRTALERLVQASTTQRKAFLSLSLFPPR